MKPESWSKERAESFLDEDTVKAYCHRAPYPQETFDILISLISDEPRTVLDVGCGMGAVARNIANKVTRVDALDPSQTMIDEGRKLPNGNHPSIRWIKGSAEDAPLNPPYAQIVAAMSIHWLDWDTVMPRFASLLTSNGYLVILYNSFNAVPWHEEVQKLRREVRISEFPRPIYTAEELEKSGLFARYGEKETTPIKFRQTVDDYIEQFHSRSDMARVRIGNDVADRFDDDLRKILSGYITGNTVEIELYARIVWGKPLSSSIVQG
jgi:SAM-dependent methyltransferase